MTTKYHLYMDEAGSFEGAAEKIDTAKRRPLIFGLLVPHEQKLRLALEYQNLLKRYRYAGFPHAQELAKADDKEFREFCTELVDQTIDSPMVPFVIWFGSDLYSELPSAYQESFAANRYLNMAQAVIEHLLFLHPRFFEKDLIFALHPNSRVYPVPNSKVALQQEFSAMGMTFNPKTTKDSRRYYVWTNDTLRAYLHRIAMDFLPWRERVGARSWDEVEAVVASRSDDPFVHWVDNLAWILRWRRFRWLTEKLARKLTVEIDYGPQQQTYRHLVRLYLDGNMRAFLSQTLGSVGEFSSKSYYGKSLEALLSRSLSSLSTDGGEQILELEAVADRYLRESRGNWQLVQQLVSHLLEAVARLEDDERGSPTMQRVLARLYGHQVSIHNHRGEYGAAWRIHGQIEDCNLGPLSLADYREQLARANRKAVTSANVFAFEEGNRALAPLVDTLERSLAVLAEEAGAPLSDALLGRMLGTMSQNYAFMAPRDRALFEQAETQFLRARDQFSSDRDRVRQDTYLLHLYLDWGNMDKARQQIERLQRDPAIAAFSAEPSAASALSMQFALSVLLKYLYYQHADWQRILGLYPLNELQEWFGAAAGEHPFELIFGYLGRMAYGVGDAGIAQAYYRRALAIPASDHPEEQPTLQTIRAQIWLWWALDEAGTDERAAREKMEKALAIMHRIGTTEGLEPILRLREGEPETGWFAPGWQALKAASQHEGLDADACKTFLECFTFNYH